MDGWQIFFTKTSALEMPIFTRNVLYMVSIEYFLLTPIVDYDKKWSQKKFNKRKLTEGQLIWAMWRMELFLGNSSMSANKAGI